MESRATFSVAFSLFAVVAGCGSRAGLDTPEIYVFGPDGSVATGTGTGNRSGSGAGGQTTLCARHRGPISCSAGPAMDEFQVCISDFPECVQPTGSGDWACCNGGPPFNGSSGNCLFAGWSGASSESSACFDAEHDI